MRTLAAQPQMSVVGHLEGYGLQPVHQAQRFEWALAPESVTKFKLTLYPNVYCFKDSLSSAHPAAVRSPSSAASAHCSSRGTNRRNPLFPIAMATFLFSP